MLTVFYLFMKKKKNTPISAFNVCSGRGKHPELAEEEAAKGDVELAGRNGGGNGFVAPAATGAAAAAAAAPSSLPASSSAKV